MPSWPPTATTCPGSSSTDEWTAGRSMALPATGPGVESAGRPGGRGAGSTPVVSFGDPRRASVVTLGINPSSRQFVRQNGALREGTARRVGHLAVARALGLGGDGRGRWCQGPGRVRDVLPARKGCRTGVGSTPSTTCCGPVSTRPTTTAAPAISIWWHGPPIRCGAAWTGRRGAGCSRLTLPVRRRAVGAGRLPGGGGQRAHGHLRGGGCWTRRVECRSPTGRTSVGRPVHRRVGRYALRRLDVQPPEPARCGTSGR